MPEIVLPYPPSEAQKLSKTPQFRWTKEQEQFLRDNYPSRGKQWCAKALDVKESQIRSKASLLGLKQDRSSEFFKEWQANAAVSKVGKKRPGQAEVMRKAIIEKGLHLHSCDHYKLMGKAVAERIHINGHPRGFYGRTHSGSTRAKMSQSGLARSLAEPEEIKQSRILKGLKTRSANGTLVNPRPKQSWKQGWREVGGQRCYFRSKWEANYARYLEYLIRQKLIAKWEHEPETFWFEDIKRGCRSYLPDFRVTENDGRVIYHEVKGWMDDRSKTKIKRMAKYHPNITLLVIAEKGYKEIQRKMGGLIHEWE
jgi:hypothetical protein